jgi:hypothetical protein
LTQANGQPAPIPTAPGGQQLPAGYSYVPNTGPASLSGSAGKAFSGLVVSVASGQCGCSAKMDWGDGSGQAQATADVNPKGGVSVTGSHTYSKAGTYSILVLVDICATECHGPLVRDAVQQTIAVS